MTGGAALGIEPTFPPRLSQCQAWIPRLAQLVVKVPKKHSRRAIIHRPQRSEKRTRPRLEDRARKTGEIIPSFGAREAGFAAGQAHEGTTGEVELGELCCAQSTILPFSRREEQL